MAQVELACKDLVFHFNKKHLEDDTIPMWIIMAKGKTYYVDHVTSNLPWTTKETPLNIRTKGAIKFKNALLQLEDGSAEITELTEEDKERLAALLPTRIHFRYKNEFLWLLQHNEIKHGPCMQFAGGCGRNSYVIEIAKDDLTMLALAYANQFEILTEDSPYYTWYGESINGKEVFLNPEFEGHVVDSKTMTTWEDEDLDE